MAFPELQRQWNTARPALNTILQPQFQALLNPPQGDGQQTVPQGLQEEAECAHLRQQKLADQQLPLGCHLYAEPDECFSLGSMNGRRSNCRALHFESEKLTSSTCHGKKNWLCCLQGKVNLPDLDDPPEQMLHLLRHVNNAPFWKKICQYNSAFVFTSVGVKLDESVTWSSGPYAFKKFMVDFVS